MIHLARCILGGVFVYLGLVKALHPVDFLKVVHQYGVFENHVALNLVAAILPWFEVFCGLLLVCRIAVRGSTLAVLALLIPFSGMVFNRAWALHQERAIAFCAVRFDCGCGTGDVIVCGKLLENLLLALLAGLVLVRHRRSTPEPKTSAAV